MRLNGTIRERGIFDKYYTDHKTFNISNILFFNEINFCDYSCDYTLITNYFLLTKIEFFESYEFLLHMMTSKAFSNYFLLKAKDGIANL